MGWMGQDSPGGVLHLKSRHAHGAKTDAGRNGIHEQAEHHCQESCGCQQPGQGLAPQSPEKTSYAVSCRPLRYGSRERVIGDDDPNRQAVASGKSGSHGTG